MLFQFDLNHILRKLFTTNQATLLLLSVIFQATYFEELCYNVISEIGFGPGALKRVHDAQVREGIPYLIPGKDYSGGIPGIPSMVIDYDDPGSQLTFHWFKHHIMCRDHPSICNQHSPRRQERREQMEKEFTANSGTKSLRSSYQKISEQIKEKLRFGS